jgi:hypothetical protein
MTIVTTHYRPKRAPRKKRTQPAPAIVNPGADEEAAEGASDPARC